MRRSPSFAERATRAARAASLFLAPLAAAAPGAAQGPALPPPPDSTDAGGANVPDLGMRALQRDGGLLVSGSIDLPPDLIPPLDPAPLGTVLAGPPVYVPDLAPDPGGQGDLSALLSLGSEAEYPLPLAHANTDPSGSLDESALDAGGAPVHFNLHWPAEPPVPFRLADQGLDPASPTEDLAEILTEIAATGSTARVQEALDVLLGTDGSGALAAKAYRGFPLLAGGAPRVQDGFDPVTRNVEVTQLWFDDLILTDADLLRVPAEGDFTVTWKVRGLGDPGPTGMRAFPIDEVGVQAFERSGNLSFFRRNAWIWKWFDLVQDADGRKYTLASLFAAHTGTPFDEQGQPVPSYAELDPANGRDFLFANRRFDLGGYVGQAGVLDELPWQTLDLDHDGAIGGFLADGTPAPGGAFDAQSNPDAQFNAYGRNEAHTPLVDWSRGGWDAPFCAYDSTFATLRRGQGFDLVVRYGGGARKEGLRLWGWRRQPHRAAWVQTFADGELAPDGRPRGRALLEPWEEVAALGLAAVGEHSPLAVLHDALQALAASSGSAQDVADFAAAVEGYLPLVRERRGLPPTDDVAGFPAPGSDLNLLYTNLGAYGDRETIAPGAEKRWSAGDVLRVTVYNDDEITRALRVLDLGTTDYQFDGNDMGRLDWKPIWGAPQYVAAAWSRGYDEQSEPLSAWAGTALDGIGNPFLVDPLFDDPAGFSPAGQHDLAHVYADLSGFSGPGFHGAAGQTVWYDAGLAPLAPGAPGLFTWLRGIPLPPKSATTFDVVLPRAQPLNNGALFFYDPRFPARSGYALHPRSVREIEGLGE